MVQVENSMCKALKSKKLGRPGVPQVGCVRGYNMAGVGKKYKTLFNYF